ncbi:MAG: hypothetical protein ACXADO_02830 [Candidatus Thorarchaeota archaeon]|jgi:hypothetical protein
MIQSDERRKSGLAGMGRWLAVGSELPCSVIILLYIGYFLGLSMWGPEAATTGAIIGALVGFVFGVYSVYVTIGYYDTLEEKATEWRTYAPPPEELYEEFDLPGKDEPE